jgi:hypothetical protein
MSGPKPPKYRPGDHLNGSVIVSYDGRQTCPTRKKSLLHHYTLTCACGNTFVRHQESLSIAMTRCHRVTCGCRDTELIDFPPPYNPTVPCNHNWGYNPRP